MKPTNEIRYIDRVELPDYALALYETLEEAADGDGYNDYLIDDKYFDLSGEDISSNEPGDFIRGNMTVSSTGTKVRFTAVIVTSTETAAADEDTHTYVYNCIRTVYAAFRRDHPEVFWLSGVRYIRYISNGRNYYCYVLSQNSETSGAWDIRLSKFRPGGDLELREVMAKRDADVEKILDTIPAGADRFTQIYYLNKWLTENNEYNTIVSNGLSGGLPSNSIDRPWDSTLCVSALAGQEGTAGPECGGYAQAFQVLCNKLGIPCVHVRYDHNDTVGRAHSWNYVQMEDGKWYAVDVTANDGGSGKLSGRERTDYLLVGGKTVVDGVKFLERRPPENPFSSIMDFPNGPVLNDDAYPRKLHLSYMGMPERLDLGDSVSMTPVLLCGSDTDYTYSSTDLPAGLTLNSDTGRITGTVTDESDVFTVTVTATNSADSADAAQCTLQFPVGVMYANTLVTFSDVKSNDWFKPYVEKAAAAGLVNGIGNGKYDPLANLELSQAMVLAYQIDSKATGRTLPQASGAWYMPYYQYCLDNGIITASQVSQSDLTRKASRFEMVAILDKAVPAGNLKPVKTVDSVPDLAENAPYGETVYKWYRAGILSGDSAGRFNGNSNISRAEVAAILCRLNGL